MILSFGLYIYLKANWRETSPATLGPTAPAFAFSAPVLHIVFANRPAFVVSADVAFAATTIPAALRSHRDRPNVSQHQGLASIGHSMAPMSNPHSSPFAGSQNADLSQLESHTNATGFPGQIVNNIRGRGVGVTPVRGYGNGVDEAHGVVMLKNVNWPSVPGVLNQVL